MTGRPRAFEEGKVVKAAMSVFWAKGFEGASYAQLSKEMGMNRPSIYGAFGDKEALFLRTLDHYMETYAKPTLDKLEMGETVRECVELFLLQVIDNCTTQEHPGCLVTTVLSDSTMVSPKFQERMKEAVALADEHIARRMDRAMANGELPAASNTKALARIINNTRYGFAVRARAGESRKTLQQIASETIELLFPLAPQPCS